MKTILISILLVIGVYATDDLDHEKMREKIKEDSNLYLKEFKEFMSGNKKVIDDKTIFMMSRLFDILNESQKDFNYFHFFVYEREWFLGLNDERLSKWMQHTCWQILKILTETGRYYVTYPLDAASIWIHNRLDVTEGDFKNVLEKIDSLVHQIQENVNSIDVVIKEILKENNKEIKDLDKIRTELNSLSEKIEKTLELFGIVISYSKLLSKTAFINGNMDGLNEPDLKLVNSLRSN